MPRVLEKARYTAFTSGMELCRVADLPAVPDGAVEVVNATPLLDWTPTAQSPYAAPAAVAAVTAPPPATGGV